MGLSTPSSSKAVGASPLRDSLRSPRSGEQRCPPRAKSCPSLPPHPRFRSVLPLGFSTPSSSKAVGASPLRDSLRSPRSGEQRCPPRAKSCPSLPPHPRFRSVLPLGFSTPSSSKAVGASPLRDSLRSPRTFLKTKYRLAHQAQTSSSSEALRNSLGCDPSVGTCEKIPNMVSLYPISC